MCFPEVVSRVGGWVPYGVTQLTPSGVQKVTAQVHVLPSHTCLAVTIDHNPRHPNLVLPLIRYAGVDVTLTS